MSVPTNAAAKADTKRGRSSEAESTGPDSTDRSVRQRIEPSAGLSAPAPPAAAASAAVSAVAVAVTPPSFMRLAVVERQLIMQALDLSSLAQLASTCRQLRAEALHREAGKFIPEASYGRALYKACFIDKSHLAHASPLFRKHMSMQIGSRTPSYEPLTNSTSIDSLLDIATLFSRVTTFSGGHSDAWTEPQMLRLLSLPCMQHVETMHQLRPMWLEYPSVQAALFRLPRLRTCEDVTVTPTTTILPGAIALASKMASLYINADRDYADSVRSLRALRLAPALVSLYVDFHQSHVADSVLPELVWCLPPTLTKLILWGVDVNRNTPRPLAKALFSHTPLLELVQFSGCIETTLRGCLDAGMHALPMLRRVTLTRIAPHHFSFAEDPDPLPPLLRRFLRRFPEVTVHVSLNEEDWEDEEQLSAMQVRYVGWPRVELYWADSDERIGGPPSPHSSDDEAGSDVEELADPLTAETGSASL